MFPLDRREPGQQHVWASVHLLQQQGGSVPENSDAHGIKNRMGYAFAALLSASCDHLGKSFSDYVLSEWFYSPSSSSTISSSGGDASELLLLSDCSGIESAFLWLRAMVSSAEVNIKGSGLRLMSSFAAALSMPRIDQVILRIIAMGAGLDSAFKNRLKRLADLRKVVAVQLNASIRELLQMLKRDKITDIDSIRVAMDFIVMHNRSASEYTELDIEPPLLCAAQALFLSKASQSPVAAAEQSVASTSLEEEIKYYSARRREYVRALCLLSHQLFVMSMSAARRAAPDEWTAVTAAALSGPRGQEAHREEKTAALASLEDIWSASRPSSALHGLLPARTGDGPDDAGSGVTTTAQELAALWTHGGNRCVERICVCAHDGR